MNVVESDAANTRSNPYDWRSSLRRTDGSKPKGDLGNNAEGMLRNLCEYSLKFSKLETFRG